MSHGHGSDSESLTKQHLFILRYRGTDNVNTLIEFYQPQLIIRKMKGLSTHWNFEKDREKLLMFLNQMYELYPEQKYPEYYL